MYWVWKAGPAISFRLQVIRLTMDSSVRQFEFARLTKCVLLAELLKPSDSFFLHILYPCNYQRRIWILHETMIIFDTELFVSSQSKFQKLRQTMISLITWLFV